MKFFIIFLLFISPSGSVSARAVLNEDLVWEKVEDVLRASEEVSLKNQRALRDARLHSADDPSIIQEIGQIKGKENQRQTGELCEQTSLDLVVKLKEAFAQNCDSADLGISCNTIARQTHYYKEKISGISPLISQTTKRLERGDFGRGTNALSLTLCELQGKKSGLESSLATQVQERQKCSEVLNRFSSNSCKQAYQSVFQSHVSTLIANSCAAPIIKGQVQEYIKFMNTSPLSPIVRVNELAKPYKEVRSSEKKMARSILTIEKLMTEVGEFIKRIQERNMASPLNIDCSSKRPQARPRTQ